MCYLLQEEANFFLTLSYFKNILGCFNLSSIICLVFLWSPLLGFMVKLKIEKAILHNLKNRYSYIVFIERVQKNGVIIWGTLFIRTTFYKNSQPQIWYFEIGISKNIHANAVLSLKFSQAGQNVLPQKVEARHFERKNFQKFWKMRGVPPPSRCTPSICI